MTTIKCAHCESINVDFVDEVVDGKECYYCDNCNKYFYSHFAIVEGEEKLQVSKDLWKNFKTIV